MARRKPRGRSGNSARKGDNSVSILRDRDVVPQSQDARRVRTIDETQGIQPLELQPVETAEQVQSEDVVTPVGNAETRMILIGHVQGNRTWSSLSPVDGMNLNGDNNLNIGEMNMNSRVNNGENVKITFKDIRLEVEY